MRKEYIFRCERNTLFGVGRYTLFEREMYSLLVLSHNHHFAGGMVADFDYVNTCRELL